MAGVMFAFYDFTALVELNIGLADRLNENRSESFAVMLFDFSEVIPESVEPTLGTLLRTSDSLVHYDHHYFVVMPYTDRYGTGIVKKMVNERFATAVPSAAVCYPADGETPLELLEKLHEAAKNELGIDLDCLYSALNKEP